MYSKTLMCLNDWVLSGKKFIQRWLGLVQLNWLFCTFFSYPFSLVGRYCKKWYLMDLVFILPKANKLYVSYLFGLFNVLCIWSFDYENFSIRICDPISDVWLSYNSFMFECWVKHQNYWGHFSIFEYRLFLIYIGPYVTHVLHSVHCRWWLSGR